MLFRVRPYIVIEQWFTNSLLPPIPIKPVAIINVKSGLSRSISAFKLIKLNITNVSNVTQDQKLQETVLYHDESISK